MNTTPIERVLQALGERGEVKPRGKGWRCHCPAHDDARPSLDVDVGDDERVLLICRSANCSVKSIVASIGLTERDLMPNNQPKPSKNGEHKPPKKTSARSWLKEAERYRDALTPERRKELANALGLPVESLDSIELLGWNESKNPEWTGWTFPERDGTGAIIGIVVRGRDGQKKSMSGSSRGYSIPQGWREKSGPLFLVEGASDVVALSHCGLAAIGRPSNNCSVEQLAKLLNGYSEKIVIVCENDQKPDGKWPGRDVAIEIAKKLSTAIGRPVSWSLPPSGIKDVRAWVLESVAGWGNDAEPWQHIGVTIRTELERTGKSDAARFEFISSPKFASGDYRPEWLVNRVLVGKQPAVIAGPSKALKTSVSIDLAVSLASGTDFLGAFKVPRRARVAVVSGESGEHTLQETAKRISKSKRLLLDDLGEQLQWCFKLPRLTDLPAMKEFARELTKLKTEVVIIDPFYQALGTADAKSLFDVGDVLGKACEILLAGGSYPVIVHHSNRQLPIGEPMELQHLAYSGLEQFARQWLLLNRREKYQGKGIHDLWATIGGSAGHGGIWNLYIAEGVVDEGFNGREWNVEVKTLEQVKEVNSEQKAESKREAQRQKNLIDEKAIRAAIAQETKTQAGATQRSIRDITGLSANRVSDLIESLLESAVIEEVDFKKEVGKGAGRTVTGYKCKPGF
jgi:hypothetical protein